MHFSEELELLYLREVELPGEGPRSIIQRSLFTSENDFLFVTSLGPEHAYHRLYMRIALDGSLTKFHEETEDCGRGIMINAIFEFPEGNRFGEYRISYEEPGYLTLWSRLFGFNDDFVFDILHEYGNIIKISGDTVHSIVNDAHGNGTDWFSTALSCCFPTGLLRIGMLVLHLMKPTDLTCYSRQTWKETSSIIWSSAAETIQLKFL